jgi:hypothetical protein
MRSVVTFACVVILTCFAAAAVQADKRAALVIGNSAYRQVPALPNPKNDAEDVGRSLQALGFETIVATDLDRGGMNDALERFSRLVSDADVALFYYSGHGMQYAGRNYLLPVDAQLTTAGDVNRFRLMPLDDVTDVLQAARGARVIVLDACRDNPLENELKRGLAGRPGANRDVLLARGLAPLDAGNGQLVAYATQAGDVAADGAGHNSPFTAAFLKNIGTPDIDLRQMFFRVQDEVNRLTNGRQRPELSISLIGEFKLNVSVALPGADSANHVPLPTPADPAAQAWAAVKDTTSIAMLEQFRTLYAGSVYAPFATARIEELKKVQAAALAPPGKPLVAETPRPTTFVPSRSTFEPDVDRRGLDYRNFDLPKSDPHLCQGACLADANCRAWAFVRPGVQGPASRCWLKNAVPRALGNSCCVSGVIE